MTDLSVHNARLDSIRKSHWRQHETDRDHEDRADAAEASALWYFDQATKGHKAAYNAAMAGLSGLYAPRHNRAREAAKAAWYASTANARDLFADTFEQIMATGEVPESMSARWDALYAESKQAEAA